MQQKVLTFHVDGQYIRTQREKVVADSRNYLVAQFYFSEQWQELPKTAVFQSVSGEVYHVLLEDDRCMIPPEVIIPTHFLVSVFGGDRLTADTATVEVSASGYAAGGEAPVPTPDLYTQLVSTVETERQLAQAAAVTASEKAELCRTDADMAGTHAVTASVAADDAAAKATAAAFYAEQSAQALENAQTTLDNVETLMETIPDVVDTTAALNQRVTDVEAEMDATTQRMAQAEETLADYKATTTVPYVIGSGEGDRSLIQWCDKNIVEGLQVIQVGAGITDCPETTCLAFYACDQGGGRRALCVFGHAGSLYFRTYKNGVWYSWRSVTGTAVQ